MRHVRSQEQQLPSLAVATADVPAPAITTANEIATVQVESTLLPRIACWCHLVACWLLGVMHDIVRPGRDLVHMWHARFGYIWGLVVLGVLIWVSKALFNLVSAEIF